MNDKTQQALLAEADNLRRQATVLHAHAAGDQSKAEHRVITTAAACANWHRAMRGQTDMRPGIDGDAAMKATGEW